MILSGVLVKEGVSEQNAREAINAVLEGYEQIEAKTKAEFEDEARIKLIRR